MVKDVILVVIMVARAAKLVEIAKNAILVLVTVVQKMLLLYQDVLVAINAIVAIAVDIAILVMIALNVLAVFIVLINVIPMTKLTVWQQNTKTKMLDMNKQIELLKNFFMI